MRLLRKKNKKRETYFRRPKPFRLDRTSYYRIHIYVIRYSFHYDFFIGKNHKRFFFLNRTYWPCYGMVDAPSYIAERVAKYNWNRIKDYEVFGRWFGPKRQYFQDSHYDKLFNDWRNYYFDRLYKKKLCERKYHIEHTGNQWFKRYQIPLGMGYMYQLNDFIVVGHLELLEPCEGFQPVEQESSSLFKLAQRVVHCWKQW